MLGTMLLLDPLAVSVSSYPLKIGNVEDGCSTIAKGIDSDMKTP